MVRFDMLLSEKFRKSFSFAPHVFLIYHLCIGRIVICLDSDNAGINAVERLCSGTILSSVTSRYPVEIRIASLPEGLKDPADYLEQNTKSESLEEDFRKEVIDSSVEWTEWYTQHIISGYDASVPRGSSGSFGDVFERLASFLATFQNPAERTKRACELASYLAEIISNDNNNTQVSKSVRIQLEADLVEKSSNIADSRAAISGRIASVDGGSPRDTLKKLSSIVRGDGISGLDESKKLISKALKKREKDQVSPQEQEEAARAPKNVRSKQGRRFKERKPASKNVPSLTPHFSGFDFSDELDARWLGLIDDQVRLCEASVYDFELPLPHV
jgi:DNA primase